MALVAGIDVGSSTVKTVVMEGAGQAAVLRGDSVDRIRRRDPGTVIQESYGRALAAAGAEAGDVAYLGTTGEGELVPFRTGHFYSMTTHARGGLYLQPQARAVLDVGALHAKAILMDERSRVLGYRMTNQCASGSGQFLENIARYLGIALDEVGTLSRSAQSPEKCSSICAVLAETDVINMVSRGIATPDILKGIHLSMAGRLVRLLVAAKVDGLVLMTGGLAADEGLRAAVRETLAAEGKHFEVHTHPRSILAGAIGAALWGAYRHGVLAARARTAAGRPASLGAGAP